MKPKSFLLYGVFIGLIVILVLMFMPYPGQDELMVSQNPTPPAQDDASFNPDYGKLSEDEKSIADRAIGELLNSTEGLNPSMISISKFEAREFGNTSLDCPQPDQMYAEVITPGYQIVLAAQGQEYDYRLDTLEAVILCQE